MPKNKDIEFYGLKFSLWNLWIFGVLLWFFYAIATIVFFLDFSTNELDVIVQIKSCLGSSVFIAYFLFVTKKAYAQKKNELSEAKQKVLYRGMQIMSIAFVIANILPRKITLLINDSPFDKNWYSAPQIAVGFPTPYARFFNGPLEGYSNPIIDIASLFSNVLMYAFLIYIFMGVYIVYDRFILNKRS